MDASSFRHYLNQILFRPGVSKGTGPLLFGAWGERWHLDPPDADESSLPPTIHLTRERTHHIYHCYSLWFGHIIFQGRWYGAISGASLFTLLLDFEPCLMSRLWNERSTIFYYLGLLTKRDLKKLSVWQRGKLYAASLFSVWEPTYLHWFCMQSWGRSQPDGHSWHLPRQSSLLWSLDLFCMQSWGVTPMEFDLQREQRCKNSVVNRALWTGYS